MPLCRSAVTCAAVLYRAVQYPALSSYAHHHNPRYHRRCHRRCHHQHHHRRRSTYRQGNARYLTPVLDLANHAAVEDGGGSVSCGASGELMLRAGRALAVGDEVLLDYQVANGPLMLATYGFLNSPTVAASATPTTQGAAQQPGYCVEAP